MWEVAQRCVESIYNQFILFAENDAMAFSPLGGIADDL